MDLQPDFWGRRERAEEARTVLGSPIFGMAVKQLRADYFEEIEKLSLNSPNLIVAHAKLKVLDDVAGSLERYVNEEKFARKEHAA